MLKRTPFLILALLLFLLTSLIVTALAQEDSPLREAERTAPEREPVILQTKPLANDRVQTIIQLPAVADTYIASERPYQNFGSSSLFLGYNLAGVDNFGAERILLRFDIENHIPNNAIIHSAALRLRLIFSSPAGDTAMGTVLRRLASPWDELTTTWNSEPGWAPVADVTYVGSTIDWYEWQVTDLVQNWHDNVYANYGVELIGDETIQQRERAFYSRETTTAYFPQLVIDFTMSDDTSPPDVSVNALPTYSRRSFTVSWSGDDVGGAGIDYYDVQVRIDGGGWQDWLVQTTEVEAEYSEGENGRFYEFRARGVDNVGNIEPFGDAEASTTVDSQPPLTLVAPLPAIIDTTDFTVSWNSDTSVSGIHYYDVQYQVGNDPWQLWLSQTTLTSALFTAPVDGVYRFEARAADNSGLLESFTNQAEASIIVDTQPPFVTPQLWLPIVANQYHGLDD